MGHGRSLPRAPGRLLDRPIGGAIRPLGAGLYKPRRRPPSIPTLTLIHLLPPAAARLASLLQTLLSSLISHPLASRPLPSSSRAPVRGRGLVPALADGTALETHHLDLAQIM